ncbi:MAG: hypothetical protein ABWZ08_14125 [Pseudoxanthomonas sp.]
MPDNAGASLGRSVSFERRRRLRRWARLRQGMCVTLACVAVALAPSWDARSASPATRPPTATQTPVPSAADAGPDIQQLLHAPGDRKLLESLGEVLD